MPKNNGASLISSPTNLFKSRWLNTRVLFDIFVLLIISLTPFWWLRDGSVVLGHDAGTPLSPTDHFVDRLNTWTDRYSGGSDQTYALGAFFLHGFEATLDRLPLSVPQQQSLEFSIYFFLFGISMYLFTKNVFGDDYPYIPLIASVFYQLNHFILQAWFIAERTKFTLYIALPIFLLLLYWVFQKKFSPILLGLLAAVLLTLFNGGGFIPLYGAIAISSGVFVTLFWLTSATKLKDLRNLLIFGVVTVLGMFFLQMFWLLPYVAYVKSSFSSEVAASGGIDGVIGWLTSISENTSFMNLFRLQGIQEWYVNPQHPYARFYSQNLFLLLSSFTFPAIPFLALAWKDKKTTRLILSLLAMLIIGTLFMAGSHAPFGSFYIALIKYLPGFIAFRTPYYKFAPTFFFAFAVLLGYVSNYIFTHFFKQKTAEVMGKLLVVFLIALYHFPFFSVNFFQYTHTLSTKVQVPTYVYDYAKFTKDPAFTYQRTMLLPGANPSNNVYYYNWGFWSLASLHSLLDRHPYIVATSGRGLQDRLVRDLYQSIRTQEPGWENTARALGIDSFLIEKDTHPYELDGEAVTVDQFLPSLKNSTEVTLVKTFGDWELYSLKNVSQFTTTNTFYQVIDQTDKPNLASLFFQKIQVNPAVPFSSTDLRKQGFVRAGMSVFPACQDCTLVRTPTYIGNRNIVLTPASFLYPIFNVLPSWVKSKHNNSLPSLATETLQDLYLLETMFVRKEPDSARLEAWNNYIQDLQQYQKLLDKELTNSEKSVDKNNYLKGFYTNITNQVIELPSVVKQIQHEDESEAFFTAKNLQADIQNKLEKNIQITQKLHENVYLLDLPEDNSYTINLFVPSSNFAQQQNIKDLKLSIDDQNHSFAVNTQEKWFSLGQVPFSKGLHRVVFNDIPYQQQVNLKEVLHTQGINEEPDGSFKIDFGGKKGCSSIPLETFSDDKFFVSFSFKAEVGTIEPTFHLTPEGSTTPLLPYFGKAIKATDATWEKVELPVLTPAKKNYTLDVCDISSPAVITLLLKDLKIDHATEPLIGFSVTEKSSTPLQATQLTSQHPDNNHYVVDVAKAKNSQPSILVSHLLQTPDWQLNNSGQKMEQLTINGNKAAWILPQVSQDNIQLEYTRQRKLRTGMMISGVSAVVILALILGLALRHRKMHA
jgi:hypothetical protein